MLCLFVFYEIHHRCSFTSVGLLCATGTAPHIVSHITHLLGIVHAGCVGRTAQTSLGILALICSNYRIMVWMGIPVCN